MKLLMNCLVQEHLFRKKPVALEIAILSYGLATVGNSECALIIKKTHVNNKINAKAYHLPCIESIFSK